MTGPPSPLAGLARAALEHAREQRHLLGWQHGERAFAGPRVVQVDLANTCNSRCVACWLHAPAIPATDLPEGARGRQLPFDLFERLLGELRDLGTEEIYLAGGGEPLTHPRAWEAIERVVALGFTCSLHTNFTRVDAEGVRRLVSLPVHHVTVSLWAGDEREYAATHPGSPPSQFRDALDQLACLNAAKRDRPITKLYHVLTCHNAGDVGRLIAVARDSGCDHVELALADLVPGRTDDLALTREQRARVADAVRPSLAAGPGVRPRLLGGADLLRRLEEGGSGDPGRFDARAVHALPCTAGWNYARVMADGGVLPCLKAHRVPSGNLHDSTFAAIWDGEAQRRFRRETRGLRKDSPFFRGIGNGPGEDRGCERGCDNLAENQQAFARWRGLTTAERTGIRALARVFGGAPFEPVDGTA